MKNIIKQNIFLLLFLITSKTFTMQDPNQERSLGAEGNRKRDTQALNTALARNPSRLLGGMPVESPRDPILEEINAMTPGERHAWTRGLTANATPEQRAAYEAQDARLENVAKQAEELRQQAEALNKTLSDPKWEPAATGFNAPKPLIDPASIPAIPFHQRNNPQPSKLPKITPTRIAFALGAIWTATEIGIAYRSFTAEEKAQISYLKFPMLIGLRTCRNMLSRPGQIISLPAKVVALLEKKALGK